jgi:hypothetical protein
VSPRDGPAAVFGRAAATCDEVEPRMFRHFRRALVEAAGVDGGTAVFVLGRKP